MTARKRFGKSDWLALGLEQLAREGSPGLTVEALCKTAGRTRGSFYHHFADHEAFVDALMEAWKQKNTIDVTEETLKQETPVRAKKLAVLAIGLDHALEHAVRQFAQGNAAVQNTVRDVDGIRTRFIAGLYESDGLDSDLALEIAKIEYAAFVGAQIVWPDMPAEERLALDNRFASMVKAALQPSSSQE